jgi:DNA-binding transcriptional MerR regulator
MEKTKSTADASKITGFTPRQLRSHEAKGYISEPERITCGDIQYRRYTPQHITEIKRFKNYLDQGFTLAAASKKAFGKPEEGGES